MGEFVGAWCECSHAMQWHDVTGRCTYLESRFDHTTQKNINVPCECFELRVDGVHISTWPDECKRCGEKHRHIDAETELCGACRRLT